MKKIITFVLFVFVSLTGFGQLLKKMEPIEFKLLPTLPGYYSQKKLGEVPLLEYNGFKEYNKIPLTQTYFKATKRVLILPFDNMPCLLPDTESIAKMPVAFYNNLPVENIPNVFRKNNIEDIKNR